MSDIQIEPHLSVERLEDFMGGYQHLKFQNQRKGTGISTLRERYETFVKLLSRISTMRMQNCQMSTMAVVVDNVLNLKRKGSALGVECFMPIASRTS